MSWPKIWGREPCSLTGSEKPHSPFIRRGGVRTGTGGFTPGDPTTRLLFAPSRGITALDHANRPQGESAVGAVQDPPTGWHSVRTSDSIRVPDRGCSTHFARGGYERPGRHGRHPGAGGPSRVNPT